MKEIPIDNTWAGRPRLCMVQELLACRPKSLGGGRYQQENIFASKWIYIVSCGGAAGGEHMSLCWHSASRRRILQRRISQSITNNSYEPQ